MLHNALMPKSYQLFLSSHLYLGTLHSLVHLHLDGWVHTLKLVVGLNLLLLLHEPFAHTLLTLPLEYLQKLTFCRLGTKDDLFRTISTTFCCSSCLSISYVGRDRPILVRCAFRADELILILLKNPSITSLS